MRKKMRLEKYLVNSGIMSRKKLKKIIFDGEIKVNGKIELNIGTDIDEQKDIVTFRDEILSQKIFKYFVMNKPAGYLTAMSNPVNDKKTVADILPTWINKNGLAPVGRLDKDTEGVLIFTNDGDLNYELTYPDKEISKEYYVEVARPINSENIFALENEIVIDNYKCLPAVAKLLSEKSLLLTIQEGKYHQVKKMLGAVANKVTYLKRIRFGKLNLGELKIGDTKEITREDIL
ncbi:MAG: pseudouridine synthase [Fusobacteriaceae bacterium]